jgi:hypothetical protein
MNVFMKSFERGLQKEALLGSALKGLGGMMWRNKGKSLTVGFTGMEAGLSVKKNMVNAPRKLLPKAPGMQQAGSNQLTPRG